jgi:uronate dehydrogenase
VYSVHGARVGCYRKRTILLTGAAGKIAVHLRPALREIAPCLRLVDFRRIQDIAAGETFMQGDLALPAFAARATKGVDAIVHLSAAPQNASFNSLYEANIVATFNLFEAARHFGVERIVFASTMHVMGFYEHSEAFDEDSPPRPDSHYAVSKIFGEAMARLYAEKHGLRVACLRIAGVTPTEAEAEPGNWVAVEDLCALVRIGLEHPDLRFAVFHAIADYEDAPRRASAARRYGFVPRKAQETFAAFQARARTWWPSDRIAHSRLGATFASQDYSALPTGTSTAKNSKF